MLADLETDAGTLGRPKVGAAHGLAGESTGKFVDPT